MATKVYKKGYHVIVDSSLKPYNKYSQSMFCSFGFDGDNCWIKEFVDSEEYIYNDNVDQMLDSGGVPIGDKTAVEAYLVQIIGDPTDADSPLSSSYLLDNYTGAVAAWSLQKLKLDATQSAIIYRDSDQAETDLILEDTGSITLSSSVSAGGDLATWGSGTNVRVKQMYDQSGSGNHIVQTTEGNMPVLVLSNGTLQQFGGQAALQGTTAKQLATSSQLIPTNTWSIFSTHYYNDVSVTPANTVCCQHTGAADINRIAFMQTSSSTLKKLCNFNNGSLITPLYSTDIQDGPQLWTSIADSDNYYYKVNGGAFENPITGESLTPLNDKFRVMSQGISSLNPLVGFFKEMIVFASDETSNRGAIEVDINSRYNVY